ncbi:ApbE superfamily uncharacterized protein (UPF0280 family) [Caldicoprobacter guelmensis]|uniref:UPF0280 family protein n=1 Tax=Caldicoprobacter guelmensis TaxID=1170224 RepID=UPI001956CE82|nr:UPF0280 family protein [Caldicoprobacter guelmensis]MBM7582922.1 ApbE superfamily uncharacterized protein (UPF0280 family) [Caldicoprobacter guelmensis]
MAEKRFYRELYRARDLVYFNVKIEQTDLDIGAHSMLRQEALQLVKKYRKDIEDYIRKDSKFLISLVPIKCLPDAPAIVRRMCDAAQKAGVGPMAAVAGAISEFVGMELLQYSPEVIVENGGDIFLKSCRERVIAIFAGASPLSQKIGLKISAKDTPIGVCTSSGKIGHSLSFGKADAVVILSHDTALADAAATAVGNIVKAPHDIEKGIHLARRIEGVLGTVIIVDDKMGAWGNVHLVKL